MEHWKIITLTGKAKEVIIDLDLNQENCLEIIRKNLDSNADSYISTLLSYKNCENYRMYSSKERLFNTNIAFKKQKVFNNIRYISKNI